ncbi:MAG: hypothetical protein HRU20_10015 [Pseudomonadales bacterium]|nr:hypothetical protein [Pseudomonadales bacterium]
MMHTRFNNAGKEAERLAIKQHIHDFLQNGGKVQTVQGLNENQLKKITQTWHHEPVMEIVLI